MGREWTWEIRERNNNILIKHKKTHRDEKYVIKVKKKAFEVVVSIDAEAVRARNEKA